MNTTVDNQNATTTAEDKIRATATSLRDKRDKAHRDMQLSLERLRLVKQERDAIKKLTEDTKKNIETVEKESEEAKTTGLALQKDVAHLTKEVRCCMDVFHSKNDDNFFIDSNHDSLIIVVSIFTFFHSSSSSSSTASSSTRTTSWRNKPRK